MSSSSDSEDDCYTNAAKRLKIMQNKFKDDVQVLNTSELVDEEEEIEITTPNKKENPSPIKTSFKIKSLDDFDKSIPQNQRILTRSEARKRSIEIVKTPTITSHIESPTKRGKSTNKSSKSPVKKSNPPKTAAAPKTSGRGRGRRKSRPPRNSWLHQNEGLFNMTANIISIGNTAEYTDNSENQKLFTNPSASDDVMIIDDEANSLEESILEDNEEMSVKVFWQNCNVFKFNIRKYQKIIQIFEYFSSKENIEFDKLFFMFNEVILKPDDTPESINYNIGKFIEGGVVNNCIKKLDKVRTISMTTENKLILKFQFNSQKKIKPFEVEVQLNELIMKSMLKCAEYLDTNCGNLKFLFDGELIPANKTLLELDIEGGETIDVVIINENIK